MGGKMSRNKGFQYEREIARRLQSLFPNARRKLEYQSSECTGVDLENTGRLRIQCKRYKQYAPISKLEEVRENGMAALITKGDRKRDVICMYLDDFITIAQDIGELYDNNN
jgi:hypothetical protein